MFEFVNCFKWTSVVIPAYVGVDSQHCASVYVCVFTNKYSGKDGITQQLILHLFLGGVN